MTFVKNNLARRDRLFVLAGLMFALLATSVATKFANIVVGRLIEERSIQTATDFTTHLVDGLKPFNADGVYSDLNEVEQKVLLSFARNIAHIDRLLIINVQNIVVYDSLGIRSGKRYDAPDLLEAVRTRTTITRKVPSASPDVRDRHSEYIFEAYSPIIVGDEVLGVLELYLDGGEYAQTLNQAAFFCIAVISVMTTLVLVVISLVFARSMRSRRQDLMAIEQLRETAESAKQIAEESLVKQKRFLANSAHELRTPLSILKARIDGADEFSEKAGLTRDVDRLTRLVDQLLSVARLESGAISTDDCVDLRKIVKDIISDLVPLALREGKSINLHACDHVRLVQCNEFYLAQAISNLVENALRYTPAGESVDVDVTEGGVVRVADRGPGVPQDLRDKLFEPFVQGRDRKGKAGLGLAIVAETVALHGASVQVHERDGGGAVFELVLPLARPCGS